MPYYYLLLFCLIALCAFIEVFFNLNVRSSNKLYFISCLSLILTSGLKYETGIDWVNYESTFYMQYSFGKLFTLGWNDFITQFGFEPGYMMVTSIIKEFGGTIQTVYFILALINGVLLYYGIKKLTTRPCLVLLGYYCFIFFILDMSGIRQSVACCILIYSYHFIIQHKFRSYLISILIASSFHQTALFAIFLYPLCVSKQTLLPLTIAYIISLSVAILNIHWIESLVNILLPYLGFGNIEEKAVQYVLSQNFSGSYFSLTKTLFIIIILLILFQIYKKVPTYTHKVILTGLLFYGILSNFLFEIPEINTRISAYFIIFISIAISGIIGSISIKANRDFLCVIYTCYCFVFSGVYLLEKRATIPYHPYQNYLFYKAFDIKSTGEARRNIFISDHEK